MRVDDSQILNEGRIEDTFVSESGMSGGIVRFVFTVTLLDDVISA